MTVMSTSRGKDKENAPQLEAGTIKHAWYERLLQPFSPVCLKSFQASFALAGKLLMNLGWENFSQNVVLNASQSAAFSISLSLDLCDLQNFRTVFFASFTAPNQVLVHFRWQSCNPNFPKALFYTPFGLSQLKWEKIVVFANFCLIFNKSVINSGPRTHI